jgi:hypothetical protein
MSQENEELLTAMAAEAAHEVNKTYCENLGDFSQKSWNEASQWQRDSCICGVEFIRNNPDSPPSASHDSWLDTKRKDGWKYGPVKDEDKKEHPCFVPYEELPSEQKAKDTIFGAVVRGILKL